MADNIKGIFNNTLDEMIDIAALEISDKIFDEIDSSINDDDIVFSENHINAINKIISSEKNKKHKRIRKRILIAALISILTILISALTVGALRKEIYNIIVDIRERDTSFKVDNDSSLGDYWKPNDIHINVGFIPEGYEISEEYSYKQIYSVRYENSQLYFEIEKQNIPENYSIDTENAVTEYVYINDCKALLSIKPEIKIVTWINNDYIYTVSGNIDKNTLIDIAKNIY